VLGRVLSRRLSLADCRRSLFVMPSFERCRSVVTLVVVQIGLAGLGARPALCSTCDLALQMQVQKDSADSGLRVSGVVVGMESREPLSDAEVTLVSAEDGAIADKTLSDRQGRFSLDAKTPGYYQLFSTHFGFVKAEFGRRVPGIPGSRIAVGLGPAPTALLIEMPSSAAISGTVRDSTGRGISGVIVQVFESVSLGPFVNPQNRPSARTITDDRGFYRADNLPSGEYLVKATPSPTMASEVIAEADHRHPSRPTTVSLVPTYYPGTSQLREAQSIKCGAGEGVAGIDIPFERRPTHKVSVRVLPPAAAGENHPVVTLSLVEVGDTGLAMSRRFTGDGLLYTVSGVPEGQYDIEAFATTTSGVNGPDALATGQAYSASYDLVVGNDDPSVIDLQLVPAAHISGKIIYDDDSRPSSNDRAFQVALVRSVNSTPSLDRQVVSVHSGGRFDFVVPASSAFRVHVEGTEAASMVTLKVNGHEELPNAVVEPPPGGSVQDLVVVMTHHPTVVSGTILDSSGHPAAGRLLVAFDTEASSSSLGSGSVRYVQTATDGSFLFQGLPPGEYCLAALSGVRPDEMFDSAFLLQLTRQGATRIQLAAHQQLKVSFRIADRSSAR
jgi:Carboxypeptidase regulatory-like domain